MRQCGGVWGVGPIPILISFGCGILWFEFFFPLFGCWECVGKENVMEFCILGSGHH